MARRYYARTGYRYNGPTGRRSSYRPKTAPEQFVVLDGKIWSVKWIDNKKKRAKLVQSSITERNSTEPRWIPLNELPRMRTYDGLLNMAEDKLAELGLKREALDRNPARMRYQPQQYVLVKIREDASGTGNQEDAAA